MRLMKRLIATLTCVLIMFLAEINVEAKEVCEKYTNYYLFAEINGKAGIEQAVTDAGSAGWFRQHNTFFPLLPEGAKDIDKKQVCLTRDKGQDEKCVDLPTFYEMWRKVLDGKESEIKYNPTNTGDSTSYKQINVGKESWLLHGKWFEIVGGQAGNSGDFSVDFLKGVSTDALVANSILCSTTINMNDDTTNYYDADVKRTITSDNISGLAGFNFTWNSGGTEPVLLTPALYKITYTMCEDKQDYNAIIEYVYKDTKDMVEFEDGSKNPYEATGLLPGHTAAVTSPKLEGCTPDKEKVDVVIDKENPQNFKAVVEYTCDQKNDPVVGDNPDNLDVEEDNPNTADLNLILILLVIVGSSVVGVATYRERKLNEK